MRVARGPGERLPKRPRGRQGAPWRTVGEWARLRAGGRGEAPSSFKQTPRRRRAGRAQGHDESRERTGGTCPDGGAGSGASPAEAASSRPQRGRGEGSGGGRRPRGPPPAPPPGQRPWPRARRWFRVVRQQRRRLGYQGAGGGGVQLGHACTCVLSPSTCRRHEGQRGLQGPATHGETPSTPIHPGSPTLSWRPQSGPVPSPPLREQGWGRPERLSPSAGRQEGRHHQHPAEA